MASDGEYEEPKGIVQNISDPYTIKGVFVSGKGGVRPTVLITSTDPAHNPCDAFQLTHTHTLKLYLFMSV